MAGGGSGKGAGGRPAYKNRPQGMHIPVTNDKKKSKTVETRRRDLSKSSVKPQYEHAGQPTTYNDTYPAALTAHMGQGFSFKSFGAVTKPPVSERTLYQWVTDHLEFSQAKEVGEVVMENYYIGRAQMMANGQVKVVIRTTPVLDGNGNPVMDPDPKHAGRALMATDYAVAKVNPVVQCFLMRNLLKWSEKNEVTHKGDKDNPINIRQTRVMDSTERLQEIEWLRARRLELGSD